MLEVVGDVLAVRGLVSGVATGGVHRDSVDILGIAVWRRLKVLSMQGCFYIALLAGAVWIRLRC